MQYHMDEPLNIIQLVSKIIKFIYKVRMYFMYSYLKLNTYIYQTKISKTCKSCFL
jgi:hypothetical protein